MKIRYAVGSKIGEIGVEKFLSRVVHCKLIIQYEKLVISIKFYASKISYNLEVIYYDFWSIKSGWA